MSDPIIIKMGDLRAARNPDVLATAGIGSCVAIVLYDPIGKQGALAHAMLPQADEREAKEHCGKYVDSAIAAMLAELESLGSARTNLVAKLIGGAHLFSLFGDGAHSIGMRNVEEAKLLLSQAGIALAGEETGGTVGRSVTFDLANGVCSVETKM